MKQSGEVQGGLAAFYEAFNSGDSARLAESIAEGEGVSVIGTAPSEGEADRHSWLQAYEAGIAPHGITLEGGSGRAYSDGSSGFAVDTATWVLPGGMRLPTRLTAVFSEQDEAWKVVHMHFSVGVPDEQAMEIALGG